MEKEFGQYPPEKQAYFIQQAEERFEASEFLKKLYESKGFNAPAAKSVLADCIIESFTEKEYIDIHHFASIRGHDLRKTESEIKAIENKLLSLRQSKTSDKLPLAA